MAEALTRRYSQWEQQQDISPHDPRYDASFAALPNIVARSAAPARNCEGRSASFVGNNRAKPSVTGAGANNCRTSRGHVHRPYAGQIVCTSTSPTTGTAGSVNSQISRRRSGISGPPNNAIPATQAG